MNGDSPKLTIGMPVYNGQDHVPESLNSILTQSLSDFELIISDNASTDQTPQICEQFAAMDSRIRIYRNAENVGASENYNKVFRLAKSGYFKWASCNDICGPTFLEQCIRALDGDDSLVVAFTGVGIFQKDPGAANVYEEDMTLLMEDPIERFKLFWSRVRLNNVMNGVIRSSALAKTPLIKPYFASDTSLMAELALHGKFLQLPEQLFFRRMDKESATSLKSRVEVLRHWSPALEPVLLSNTRSLLQWYGAGFRSQLPVGSLLRYLGHVSRNVIWSRGKIAREVGECISHFLSRVTS
jgi:glycosyltransferase involved in cell wall biosynthesis